MPLLDTIVGALNNEIRKGFKDLPGGPYEFYGIAQQVENRDDGGGKVVLEPAVIDLDGTGIRVGGFDERRALSAYHILGLENFTKAPNDGQYGDGNAWYRGVSILSLIVEADTAKLRKTPREVADLILPYMTFPGKLEIRDQVTRRVYARAEVVHNRTNFNTFDLFSRIYRGADYDLKPSTIFIEISYQIESEFNRPCFITCKPCEDNP